MKVDEPFNDDICVFGIEFAQERLTAQFLAGDHRRAAAPEGVQHVFAGAGGILDELLVGGYDTFFAGREAYVAVYTFEDENHNKLVWKTQKGIDGDVCDFFKVKGTVKEHSEYRGEKQTVLTRCKVEAA